LFFACGAIACSSLGSLPLLYSSQLLGTGEPSPRPPFDRPHRGGGGGGQKVAIVLSGATNGETIRPGVIDGAYRAIGMAKDAEVAGLTVDGMQARVVRDCIRIIGERIVLRDVHCSMLPGPQMSMHEMPEGLHIQRGSNITIEHSSFTGFQMMLGPKDYWNGDGIAAEKPVSDLTFRDVISNDNSDAGFDIKPPVSMDRVSASGNCRNFRFWSDADIGTITVGDVDWRGGSSRCAGIWVAGSDTSRPKIHIRNLIVDASKPLDIIKVAKGAADITIDHCVIHAPKGTHLLGVPNPGGPINADRTCRID
jgi:hypothetical protein